MSKIHSRFSSQLITSNVSSILIVFRRFSTCIALGDVDLCVSLSFVPKVDAEGGITRDACLYHRCNQSIHVTGGMTVMPLSARPQRKTSAATSSMPNHIKPKIITYHLCQIALNQSLSCKFKSGVNFNAAFKQNCSKKK
jgi:hypothetical protein